jgi:mannose-6-phosphate isomerase-like protein (cupin superfamily)
MMFNERRFEMTSTATAPRIVGPTDGETVNLGAIGARFMIDTEETHNGGFSLVEHPMPPRALAAPLHRHSREDEYSYVIEGRMGALLGGEVVHAEVGDLVFKPRDQWHTFWNAGETTCRILEIISPAGFEHYFGDAIEGSS